MVQPRGPLRPRRGLHRAWRRELDEVRTMAATRRPRGQRRARARPGHGHLDRRAPRQRRVGHRGRRRTRDARAAAARLPDAAARASRPTSSRGCRRALRRGRGVLLHEPRARRAVRRLRRAARARCRPGGTIFLLDGLRERHLDRGRDTCSPTERARRWSAGLDDGRAFTIVKRFRTDDELRAAFARAGSTPACADRDLLPGRFAARAPDDGEIPPGGPGGGGGIRTHGGLPHAGFQDRSFRPLRHPSGAVR